MLAVVQFCENPCWFFVIQYLITRHYYNRANVDICFATTLFLHLQVQRGGTLHPGGDGQAARLGDGG